MVRRVKREYTEDTERGRSALRLGKADIGRKRLLLVEGHPLFREGLALLLEWRTGFESIHAGSLAEARRVLNDPLGKIDLAIIDLELSDGVSLVEELREVEPDIPVLALISDQRLERHARTLRVKVDEVLSTTTDTEELIGVVERLAGRQ